MTGFGDANKVDISMSRKDVYRPGQHCLRLRSSYFPALIRFDFEVRLRNDLLGPKLREQIGEGRTCLFIFQEA
jgi:hypothetical protein